MGEFAYFDEDSGVGEVRFREDLLHNGLLDGGGVGHFGIGVCEKDLGGWFLEDWLIWKILEM